MKAVDKKIKSKMSKECAWCGKPLKKDYRLGNFNGIWFCSEDCEKKYIAEVEGLAKDSW